MVRLCDDHFVNVFLAFDVDWSESSQFRWRHSLLPSLGLIVLDAEERCRLEVTDSCRTALGKLFAGNVLAINQPEFGSERTFYLWTLFIAWYDMAKMLLVFLPCCFAFVMTKLLAVLVILTGIYQ